MMAYCIASTFSDKTAFQGWEVQRHTLCGPQESIRAWVVCFLPFIWFVFLFIPIRIWPLALHCKAFGETLKCQLLKRPQG